MTETPETSKRSLAILVEGEHIDAGNTVRVAGKRGVFRFWYEEGGNAHLYGPAAKPKWRVIPVEQLRRDRDRRL